MEIFLNRNDEVFTLPQIRKINLNHGLDPLSMAFLWLMNLNWPGHLPFVSELRQIAFNH